MEHSLQKKKKKISNFSFFICFRNDMVESKLSRKMRFHFGMIITIKLVIIIMISVVGTLTASSLEATSAANICLKPCVCKWKGGKESVSCHQAGWTEIPSSGLESTIQVLSSSQARKYQ
jgi:hypothetical protein